MNVAVVLIIIISVFTIAAAVMAKVQTNEKKRETKDKKRIPLPEKSIKLFRENGDIILEYKDVYITRWDKNIYFLSNEYEGKHFLRIDKGENMLLLIEG